MKIHEIVKESMTAGSIATVATPLGGMIKRNPTKKKPAKKKNDK